MTTTGEENTRSVSTTWEWRRVKITPPAASHERAGEADRRWWRLSRWNGRKNLTIKVKYRGGRECFYRIEARGSAGQFPGHMALHDVMDEIYGGERRGG